MSLCMLSVHESINAEAMEEWTNPNQNLFRISYFSSLTENHQQLGRLSTQHHNQLGFLDIN